MTSKKRKKQVCLKQLKKLDKEKKSLKETNKTNQENLETCKAFIKGFQGDKNHCQQKTQQLQTENSTLIDDLEKLTHKTELNIVLEELPVEQRKQIEKTSCSDIIETILSKGLLNLLFYVLNLLNIFIHLKLAIQKKVNIQ